MYRYPYRAIQANPVVVSYAQGDVNGDRVTDQVYLIGEWTQDSPFVQNITLVIQEGRSGKSTSVPLKENAGYHPSLFLGDFTGNGVDDILISIATGGSGGTMVHYMYSFLGNTPQLLFDSGVYNEQYKYKVIYQDDYKVKVTSLRNNNTFRIDISGRGTEYVGDLYDEGGKLKSPVEGFVNPISGLYPVDFDSNGVYELLAYQKIAGRYNADTLGYVLNTLAWRDREFGLQNQNVAILGS
ncbi:VCBS repeat-containing protein [Paenibacillus turpanensis]|uniref:VCBS repeat-containing protein n=1 Tax=Paenibacillus turpanensis TaxID=2689078 RepID=UPI00140C5057|nr:VCBS repeat-containing protein [Paenibacillus turpanensis]